MATKLHREHFRVERQEADFDRACDEAWRRYMSIIGMDDDGYATRVDGWERSRDEISVQFVGYVRWGSWHHYRFTGTVWEGEG